MNGARRIGVMVVDDHPLMRVGIGAIINARKDMSVVAQAGTGEEALELYRRHKPDITLMDLRLPGPMSGVDAITAIRAIEPRSRFIVVTTYDGDEHRVT
jgi:DNA-binding NarL/FixJ family response regulator